jgi:hypothetical protein
MRPADARLLRQAGTAGAAGARGYLITSAVLGPGRHARRRGVRRRAPAGRPGQDVPGGSGPADPGRADRHLDPASRRALTADLLGVTEGRAAEGRATLLITHDLDGLDQVDEVVVLDRGRITGRGSQDQLRQAGGQYQQMWEHQHPPQ